MKKVSTPLTTQCIRSLKAGDEVLLSGIIYTARDQAHQKMLRLLRDKKKLPVSLKDQIIYYCGPTLTPRGMPIGSCGPTTSSRMDVFTKTLLAVGLKGMIGKGSRSDQVVRAIKKNRAVYFVAIGGAGALLATKVKRAKVVAFKELGPEAVYRLEVKDFPLIVGVDCHGGDIFKKRRTR